VLNKDIIPAYLNFAVLHHWLIGRSEMLARAHVAQASIMGERFREIEFTYRPPEEQEAIASLLIAAQAAYECESTQATRTGELKRAVTQKLFTVGLHNESTIETEAGSIPRTWSVVELGSLGRIGNGSTPKRTNLEYWKDGYYPWLPSAKVYDRTIVRADELVTDKALSECHLPRVKAGSLVIAITGQGKTLGNCALLGIDATISQHLAYVDLSDADVDPRYVRGFVETCYKHLRQVALGGGSTKGALTCAFLRTLPIYERRCKTRPQCAA
jgi:type I restriction enzyme S subunit